MITLRHFILSIFTLIACSAWGQAIETDVTVTKDENGTGAPIIPEVHNKGRVDYEGEQMSYFVFQDMYIYPPLELKTKKQQDAWNKLVRNVKKVLPYAEEARQMMIETYEVWVQLPESERDKHMKLVEKEIRKKYTPKMKKLTFAQGKLLIKLIDRECNQSSYQIVQVFFGPVIAGASEAFATVLGASLTKRYDPEGKDRLTERVVRLVKAGQI